MKIGTLNKEARKDLLSLLIDNGFIWHKGEIVGEGFNPDQIDSEWPFEVFPAIGIDVLEKGIKGYCSVERELVWPMDKEKIILKLNLSTKDGFPLKNKGKKQKIESRVAQAEKWIGINIYSSSGEKDRGFCFKPNRVVVSKELNFIKANAQLAVKFTQQSILHGFVVALVGKNEEGEELAFFIDSHNVPIKAPNSIKVNGFYSEDLGDKFKFGCAEIDKGILLCAKKFLYEVENIVNKGNRKVESVKIGDGNFTHQNLKDLFKEN